MRRQANPCAHALIFAPTHADLYTGARGVVFEPGARLHFGARIIRAPKSRANNSLQEMTAPAVIQDDRAMTHVIGWLTRKKTTCFSSSWPD
jgi:hypothetical protein